MEQDDQNKEKVQPAKEPEPEPAPEEDGMEEKYHIQVINLLQELCDLLKAPDKVKDKKDDKDQTPDENPDNYDDSDQFDNLLD